MAAYAEFAGFYDLLMDDVDYSAWADYYLALLVRAGVVPTRLCDCACGTGAMSVEFAARGMRVTGTDLSGEMLAQAQQRARATGVQAMFAKQDMCELLLPRPVDAVVCACDGVNYLLDDARLMAFFEHVRAALRPGGALAFDISSPYKLRHTIGDNFFGEDRDALSYLWFNRYDPDAATVTMELTFFVREPDGRYRRFDETHVQKAHEPAHVAALLKSAGFARVEVFGDQTFAPPRDDAPRVHFLAARE